MRFLINSTNRIYAVGGRDGTCCLKSVENFDPNTNRWSACAPMSKRRGGVGVASLNGFLYAVGGHASCSNESTPSVVDLVERYDPKFDTWTIISNISSPRDAVGICTLVDDIFVVGGFDGQYSDKVECYNEEEGKWILVSFLSVPFPSVASFSISPA